MYAELKRKVCKQCREEKDFSLFRYRKPRGNYESYCKACESINNKKWMSNNKESQRQREFKRNLRVKFGMTEDDYYEKLESQNNGCAICRSRFSLSGRHLAVDHDHKTGKIRGLLCNECNTAIGLMKENTDLFYNATVYIEKFKK